MTTTIDNNARADMSVETSTPSTSTGTIPRRGQFAALFRGGIASAGWLMEDPQPQQTDRTGTEFLQAQMMTADGCVLYAYGSRQEWLDAERDNRAPSAETLFSLHYRRAAELDRIVSDAHEYADEHELCSEFDRFLTEHNLPSRDDREQFLAVRVEMTVHLRGTGRDEDDAFDNLDRDRIMEEVRRCTTELPDSVDFEKAD